MTANAFARARLLCSTLVLVWLTACASSGPARPTAIPTSAQTLGLKDNATPEVAADWWRAMGDPVLNQIVAQALQGQPTLAVASARLDRMLAMADVSRANGLPQTTVAVDVTRQRFTENGLYPSPIAGGVYNTGNVQLGLGWTPDLFGQNTAEIASALGQVQAARADAAAAALTLASQVSRSYIALARVVAQRELAQATLTQRSQLQGVTQMRVAAGIDYQLELHQSDVGVLEARAQVQALDEQVVLLRHQLAALSGQGPQAYDSLTPQLSALQLEALPLNLGADLLGRRADVVAARWRVEAAMQDVAVAKTQFYPNVNLGAFVGVNAIGLDKLFDNGSRQVGISPALRLPLFDAGRLRAQLRGREGDLDVAIAIYNATLLDAVKEASDAISTSLSLRLQLRDQQQAYVSAQAAFATHRARFAAGLVNQGLVLNAQSQLLVQQRALADVQARALDSQVALMKALGGGWRELQQEQKN